MGKIDLELISEEIFVNKSAFMHENKVIGRPIMHEIKVIGVLIAREIKVIACGQRIIAHLAFLLHRVILGLRVAAEVLGLPGGLSALERGRIWGGCRGLPLTLLFFCTG